MKGLVHGHSHWDRFQGCALGLAFHLLVHRVGPEHRGLKQRQQRVEVEVILCQLCPGA